MTNLATFSILPRGGYALAASRAFLEGFTPATGAAASLGAQLALAFRLDRGGVGAVRLDQGARRGAVRGTVLAGDPAAVERQAARLLGLDHDGRGWDEVGRRDPTIGALQARYPGFRAVSFASPYEAAVWGVLAARIPMTQAADLRRRVAVALGDAVTIAAATLHVLPAPATLAIADRPDGIPAVKWLRLQAVAAAALDGTLDADALRAAPSDQARARLRAIAGVGRWTADHILVRGTGATDLVALEEPRVRAAIRHAYQLAGEPDVAELAEAWRPFRTWALVLLVMHLARTGAWSAGRARGRGTRRRGCATCVHLGPTADRI